MAPSRIAVPTTWLGTRVSLHPKDLPLHHSPLSLDIAHCHLRVYPRIVVLALRWCTRVSDSLIFPSTLISRCRPPTGAPGSQGLLPHKRGTVGRHLAPVVSSHSQGPIDTCSTHRGTDLWRFPSDRPLWDGLTSSVAATPPVRVLVLLGCTPLRSDYGGAALTPSHRTLIQGPFTGAPDVILCTHWGASCRSSRGPACPASCFSLIILCSPVLLAVLLGPPAHQLPS